MFSLKQFNATIKQKPKAVRATYAFWSATVITSIIALLWLVTIPSTINQIARKHEATEHPTGNLSNVLRTIRANVADSVTVLRATTENLQATSTDDGVVTATQDTEIIDFSTFFSDNLDGTYDYEAAIEAADWYDGEFDEPVVGDTTEISGSTYPEETVATGTVPTAVSPNLPRQVLIGTTSARSTEAE